MIPISLHDSIVKLSVVQCYIIMEFPRLVSGAQPPPDFPMTQCSGLGTGLLCAAALYYTHYYYVDGDIHMDLSLGFIIVEFEKFPQKFSMVEFIMLSHDDVV